MKNNNLIRHATLLFLLFAAFIAAPAVAANAVASYYGKGFHGRKTANGERYNMYQMTAAHKRMRFGTKVKVTNRANGRSVVVRINDRGPYVKGRQIDLSYGAARKLGMVHRGVARVRLEVVGRGSPRILGRSKSSAANRGAKSPEALYREIF